MVVDGRVIWQRWQPRSPSPKRHRRAAFTDNQSQPPPAAHKQSSAAPDISHVQALLKAHMNSTWLPSSCVDQPANSIPAGIAPVVPSWSWLAGQRMKRVGQRPGRFATPVLTCLRGTALATSL